MCLKPRDLPENRGTPRRQRGCRPLVGRHEGLDAVDLTHEAYHWTVRGCPLAIDFGDGGCRLSAARSGCLSLSPRPRGQWISLRRLWPSFRFQGRCSLVLCYPRSTSVGYMSRRHGPSGLQSVLQRRTPLTAKLGKLHPQRLCACAPDPE